MVDDAFTRSIAQERHQPDDAVAPGLLCIPAPCWPSARRRRTADENWSVRFDPHREVQIAFMGSGNLGGGTLSAAGRDIPSASVGSASVALASRR